MLKLSVITITIATVLLGLSDTVQSQTTRSTPADVLKGTQNRSIDQFRPPQTRPANVQSQEGSDPTAYDGTQLRTPLNDRIDLVRDRQGGPRQLGVYPAGSPNMGDEIQVEYQLQDLQQ